MKRFICRIGIVFVLVTIFGFVSCDDSSGGDTTYYTVTFDSDGGDPVPPQQIVPAGGFAAAPSIPSKSGYVFLFWYLENASPPTAYNFQTPLTADIRLVAQWEDESEVEYWQVTWQLDGGAWPANDNHETQGNRQIKTP